MKNYIPVFLSVGLFIAICALYLHLAINHPIAYIWATYEDLLGEWAQFYLFLFALIFSVRHAMLSSHYRLFFIALACACFYVLMEEISWGQRIFGWGTSEFFEKHNLQGETNLHNMLTGPYDTGLRLALEYALAVGLSGYGLIYPLALKYKWKIARWLDAMGLPAPPLYLAPFFVAAAYLELEYLAFNEAEIAEVFVGLGLSLMALHYLHLSQDLSSLHNENIGSNLSMGLAYRMLNVVFLVLLLSVATTFSLYATKEGKKRADNRIENGIEKFAGRYEKYNNWEMVVFLNKKLLNNASSSSWILRNIAEAFQKMKKIKVADKYLDKAIEIDLKKLQKKPWKASTNRNLVRSYRLKGDTVNSEKYLDQALAIGLSRRKKHPDSANAMYSLGKTYVLMDEREKARPLFVEAYRIDPTDKDFRREYYR